MDGKKRKIQGERGTERNEIKDGGKDGKQKGRKEKKEVGRREKRVKEE